MKKIEILNYITDFRKSPNAVKTYAQLLANFGTPNEGTINQFLEELKQTRVLRELDHQGEKAFQVIGR